MLNSKNQNLIGQLLLLSATIVWGSSFFVLKETIEKVPAFFVIGIRFLIASILLAMIFFKKVKNINKTTFIRGLILGIILSGAYIFQTLGLKWTTPSRNAFLTSMYTIICPFLVWIFYKKKPKIYNVISAILCVVGIGLISFSGGTSNSKYALLGDALTLVSSVFYALQIIYNNRYTKDKTDVIQMLIVNLFVVGVILSILSLTTELPFCSIDAYRLNTDQFFRILYLTLVCTLFAQGAQIFGQKLAKSTSQSAIILSLEAVFGALFSVIFGSEKLSLPLILGFLVVFISILITELAPNLFKKSKKA